MNIDPSTWTRRSRTAAAVVLCATAVLAGCAGTGTNRPVRQPPRAPGGDVVREGPSVGGEEAPSAPSRPSPPRPDWPPSTGSGPSQPSDAYPKLSETYVLKVTGMTCPIRCVREVREILEKVPGVEQVVIDQPTSKATCHVKPGTDPQTLVDAFVGQKYYAAKLE